MKKTKTPQKPEEVKNKLIMIDKHGNESILELEDSPYADAQRDLIKELQQMWVEKVIEVEDTRKQTISQILQMIEEELDVVSQAIEHLEGRGMQESKSMAQQTYDLLLRLKDKIKQLEESLE